MTPGARWPEQRSLDAVAATCCAWICALSRILARRQPLLLVLDDLHWADTSTLDLVVFDNVIYSEPRKAF